MTVSCKNSVYFISILIVIVGASLILDCAVCAPDKLMVQNVEITPRVATVGQSVRVSANIKNNGRNKKTCNVKAYVGESIIQEFNGIAINPQDVYGFTFSVDTNPLSEGKYPVEILVEEAPNEQTVFDLGTLAIGQEIPEQDISNQEISSGMDMMFLIPFIPIGAVVSFFVWKRQKRNNKEENDMSKELLPDLLNEVLNFEEKVEAGGAKNSNPSNDRDYVC